MAREKIKFALRIAPETQQLVKELCERDNCQSQNEFIEKAIRFYAGYVSGKEATAYLPPALVAAMRGTVQDSENRIARLLFSRPVPLHAAASKGKERNAEKKGKGEETKVMTFFRNPMYKPFHLHILQNVLCSTQKVQNL